MEEFFKLFLGVHIINLRKTWEKLLLAARIIVGIENPADVCVISARPYGQVNLEHYTGFVQCLEFSKKVLKFAEKFSRPGKSLENVVFKVWKMAKSLEFFFCVGRDIFSFWSNLIQSQLYVCSTP